MTASSWVDAGADADDLLARSVGAAPLATLLDEIWRSALDPVTIELVRLRVAQLLASPADLASRSPAAIANGFDDALVDELTRWPTSDRFDNRRRAALRFTEGYVIDPHGLDDHDRAEVLDHLSEPEAVALTTALATFDALTRARLALAGRAAHHDTGAT